MTELHEMPDDFRALIDEDDETGCWLWEGTRNPDGTGVWKRAGIQKRARRWAWELSGRAIPVGTRVFRTCPEEMCVNPGHAEAVPQRDRSLGNVTSDRTGECNPSAILTPRDVLAIRSQYAAGRSTRTIAKHTGMSDANIRAIITGHTWKHVTGGTNISRSRDEIAKTSPVPAYVLKARELYAEGNALVTVALILDISPCTVHGIVEGRTWKHVTGGVDIVRHRRGAGKRSGATSVPI